MNLKVHSYSVTMTAERVTIWHMATRKRLDIAEIGRRIARHLANLPDEYVLVMQAPHQGRRAKQEGRVRPWSRRTVADALDAVIAERGLDDLTPHAGRHGLATMLMEGGISPPVIAERLGNTPAMILNTYGHPTREGRERAGKMIDAYLSGDGVSGTESDAEGGNRAV